MLKQQNISNRIQVAVESIAVLFLTFLSFFIVLSLISAVFPIGQEIGGSGNSLLSVDSLLQKARNILVSRDQETKKIENINGYRARLTEMWNDVRSKRSGMLSWEAANNGETLQDGDSIQTTTDSRAVLLFDTESFLNLSENSMLTISRLEHDLFLPEKQAVVFLERGEVWGTIAKSTTRSNFIEVVTPNTTARIVNQAGDSVSIRYKVSVDERRATTVAVYDGDAEVVVGDEVIQVSRNHQVTIESQNGVHTTRPLLDPLHVISPKNRINYYYQTLVPLIKFEWAPVSETTSYRFMLARDPQFKQVVLDKTLPNPLFKYGNASPGDYYWQVFAVRGDLQGALGNQFSLRVTQDNIPPPLKVKDPVVDKVSGDLWIHGETEPEATVFVNGQGVAVDKIGHFSRRIHTNRGYNLVVIEAMDAAKNITYQTKIVNQPAN